VTGGDARRGNLRERGEPERGVYFGRDPRRPTGDGVLVRIRREARAIRLRDTAGNTVDAFGDTSKFWLATAAIEPSPAAADEGRASPTVPAERIHPPKVTPTCAEQAATAQAGLTAAVAAADQRFAARVAELAASYRLTAEAITAAETVPVPIRRTWTAAGRPATFLFYERDVQPGRPILATTTDGYRIHDTRTGQLIAHYASPVAMWIAAAPAPITPAPLPLIVVNGVHAGSL
jgi:hypothetical protein